MRAKRFKIKLQVHLVNGEQEPLSTATRRTLH